MKPSIPDLEILPVAATDHDLIDALVGADLPVEDLTSCNASFYGACLNGAVAGFGGIELYGRTCLLRSLVVLPGHRQGGLGRMLVTQMLDIAVAQGVAVAYLLTTTAPDFFRSAGFEPVVRAKVPPEIRATAEFSSLCPGDALVMCRDLSVPAVVRPESR